MRIRLIILSVVTSMLFGCSSTYTLITKDGIMYRNLKSIEDCISINKKFKLDGICILD